MHCEGSILFGFFCHLDLPEPTLQVHTGELSGTNHALHGFLHVGQGVGILLGSGIQVMGSRCKTRAIHPSSSPAPWYYTMATGRVIWHCHPASLGCIDAPDPPHSSPLSFFKVAKRSSCLCGIVNLMGSGASGSSSSSFLRRSGEHWASGTTLTATTQPITWPLARCMGWAVKFRNTTVMLQLPSLSSVYVLMMYNPLGSSVFCHGQWQTGSLVLCICQWAGQRWLVARHSGVSPLSGHRQRWTLWVPFGSCLALPVECGPQMDWGSGPGQK